MKEKKNKVETTIWHTETILTNSITFTSCLKMKIKLQQRTIFSGFTSRYRCVVKLLSVTGMPIKWLNE